MPEDWTHVRRAELARSAWFSLFEETWRMPSGVEVHPYYVTEMPAWATVLALTDRHEAVLVRQFRPGLRAVTLEMPSGSVDASDESPLHGAQRELLEETGYGGGEWKALAAVAPNPAMQRNLLHCFLARGVTRLVEPATEAHEEIDVVLMPLDELVALAESGGLPHALQITALFFALRALASSAPGPAAAISP